MDATLALAIIGAITGVLGLAWQVYSHFDNRRTKLDVSPSWALVTLGPDVVEALKIDVANLNEHAIRITGVGLLLQDGSNRQFYVQQPTILGTIPGTIPPHDAGTAFFTWMEFKDHFDPLRPVVAFAHTAAHGTFRSEPTTIFTA